MQEGIAVGRTFASINNYQVDGNKEMMAIGIMNMAGSCASCYVTTGSFSRSAVSYSAGCKTAVSNIVMAAMVLVTLLFLMPLFHYTPNVILSAIIITAVIGLIDVRGAAKLWKVDKLDFLACVSAFLGVLLVSVQMGLAIVRADPAADDPPQHGGGGSGSGDAELPQRGAVQAGRSCAGVPRRLAVV